LFLLNTPRVYHHGFPFFRPSSYLIHLYSHQSLPKPIVVGRVSPDAAKLQQADAPQVAIVGQHGNGDVNLPYPRGC